MVSKKKANNKTESIKKKETCYEKHPLVSLAKAIGGSIVVIALLTLVFAGTSIVEVMLAVTIPLVILGAILGFFIYKKL